MAATSQEQKAADAMEKHLNAFTFNSSLFAFFLTSNHIKVQERVYDVLIACISVWARRYDDGLMDTPEGVNLCSKAKRISEHLQGYK